jgi:hypothetical protein
VKKNVSNIICHTTIGHQFTRFVELEATPFLILGYRFDLKKVLGEAVKQTSRPLIQATEGIN